MVRNVGTLPLTLQQPISIPGGYTLVSSFDATTLQVGQSTSFVVRLDAAGEGTFGGTISFGNDDADENPFDFTVQALVTIPPAVQFIDDGDAGFDTVGQWTAWTGQGYQDDVHENYAGTGSEVATWTFGALLPATYRVAATWSTHTNRATNAPFSVWDSSTLRGSVQVNQQFPADDFSGAGADWETLSGLYEVNSGQLIVKLNDNADGRLNADAIRIERISQVNLAGGSSSSTSALVNLASLASLATFPTIDRLALRADLGAAAHHSAAPDAIDRALNAIERDWLQLLSPESSVTQATRRGIHDQAFARWNAADAADDDLLDILPQRRESKRSRM